MRYFGLIALAAIAISSAAVASGPSDFADPRDKMIPKDAEDALSLWRERPVWWAYGECTAYYYAISDVDQAQDIASDFGEGMADRLQRDRGIDREAAAGIIDQTVNGMMMERVQTWTSVQGKDDLGHRCEALAMDYLYTL